MVVTRRSALVHLGLGAAAALVPSPRSWAGTRMTSVDLESLVAQIRKRPRSQILDLAAEQMRKGVDYKTMLAAIYLAGVLDIEPWQVGGKLHTVFMVGSVFDLCEGASAEEAWLGTLWNLDDFKNSQQKDLVKGDWVMPPRPATNFADEASARRELFSALDAWDRERADRAIVGLIPYHTQDSLFELLWPYAARCYQSLGHKVIYAAQVDRTLRRIGWPSAEPALRSLIMSLIAGAPGKTQDYVRARDLIASFPKNWQRGRPDPGAAMRLVANLRRASSEEAQLRVIDALRQGLGAQTVWDGLRLFASELFQRHAKPSGMDVTEVILPVHAVTITNAFGYAYHRTQSESTQRLVLLQTAAFLVQVRESLVTYAHLSMEGPGIDRLGKDVSGTPSLTEGFSRYAADLIHAALDRDPTLVPEYKKQLRQALLRKGVEHHQHKFLAAVNEESLQVSPQFQAYILAPAVTYLNPNERDSNLLQQSLTIIAEHS